MLSSLLSLPAARRRGIFYLSYSNYTIHQARIHNHCAIPFLLFSSHMLYSKREVWNKKRRTTVLLCSIVFLTCCTQGDRLNG